MGSVLLATDGSEYAQKAAERAIGLAKDRETTLHVICAVDQRRFDEPARSSAELATIYAEDHAAICVAEVTEMADESGVTVEGDTRHGIPHELILEYAQEVDADVIVLGEHGDHHTNLSGVGRKVKELADRDVLIVEAGPKRSRMK